MPVSASLMAAQVNLRAILFDALGTLLTFEPPAPHLRAALLERTGTDIGEAGAKAAIRAEIAYYRAHLHEGSDPEALHDLRVRCAAAMELPFATRRSSSTRCWHSLRFHAYPDSAPDAARAAGARDPHRRRLQLGLVAARAPAPDRARGARRRRDRLGRGRLGQARRRDLRGRAADSPGDAPSAAWHVGDTPEADVEGARAAGLRPILIARDGAGAPAGDGPFARRAHTLARALMTSPEIPPPAPSPPEPRERDGAGLGAVRGAARAS